MTTLIVSRAGRRPEVDRLRVLAHGGIDAHRRSPSDFDRLGVDLVHGASVVGALGEGVGHRVQRQAGRSIDDDRQPGRIRARPGRAGEANLVEAGVRERAQRLGRAVSAAVERGRGDAVDGRRDERLELGVEAGRSLLVGACAGRRRVGRGGPSRCRAAARPGRRYRASRERAPGVVARGVGEACTRKGRAAGRETSSPRVGWYRRGHGRRLGRARPSLARGGRQSSVRRSPAALLDHQRRRSRGVVRALGLGGQRRPAGLDPRPSTTSGVRCSAAAGTPSTRHATSARRGAAPFTRGIHAPGLSVASVDHAHVRGLRGGGGHQRALPAAARRWADGALGGLRHAHPLWLRHRRPGGRRRVRDVRRGGLLTGRHGGPARRPAARPRQHVDDHQLPGGADLGDVHRGRRGARLPAGRPRGHDPERHPQGVRGAEGVPLPARAVDCAW